MRWAAVLAFSAVLGAVEIAGTNVQSVYLMPMSNGLDQFLAHQLTNAHTFSVVTDPKHADAIFTDRLGEGLQTQLEKLYPQPKPEAKKQEAAKKDDDSQSVEKSDTKPDTKEPMVKGDPVKPTTNAAAPTSGFGRGKGTLFLVEAKSGRVIWSAYEKPRNTSPDELEKVARQVVARLTKTLAGK